MKVFQHDAVNGDIELKITTVRFRQDEETIFYVRPSRSGNGIEISVVGGGPKDVIGIEPRVSNVIRMFAMEPRG